jgi:hypothetical protein
MLEKETLNRIETLLSYKKISIYKKEFSDQWFEAYKLELQEAKEIFIYLHFLEMFLRNKIAIEFSSDFGDWLCNDECQLKLNFKEKEKVKKAIEELTRTKKEINLDNIVSNLNFGFWTNIFHKPYHDDIWQRNKMTDRVFPFLKPNQRNLVNIQKEMEAIRKFRNRIFHFESLQSWNREEMKNLINKFIFGISGVQISEIMK